MWQKTEKYNRKMYSKEWFCEKTKKKKIAIMIELRTISLKKEVWLNIPLCALKHAYDTRSVY